MRLTSQSQNQSSMIHTKLLIVSTVIISIMASCNNAADTNSNTNNSDSIAAQSTITTETIDIKQDSITLKPFVAYPAAGTKTTPIVLVIPEWWGLNDYAKNRAQHLAGLGYLAVAVDMYGNGLVAETPDEAGKQASAFYGAPQMAYQRIAATLEKATALRGADTSRAALIGYCFGGAMALNAARLGLPVDAVVSFHGQLKGVAPNKEALQNVDILVLHGAADEAVPKEMVEAFKREMDSIGKVYTFKEYLGATHAFTNPKATETGKKFGMPVAYSAAADTASWEEMRGFLERSFGK